MYRALAHAGLLRRPDLTWLPIRDVDPLPIALGWAQGTKNPLVGALRDAIASLAR